MANIMKYFIFNNNTNYTYTIQSVKITPLIKNMKSLHPISNPPKAMAIFRIIS